jgi:molybdate transport system ATP-binding protein
MSRQQFARQLDNMTGLYDEPWYDTTLPADDDILKLWWNDRPEENRPEIGTDIIKARYWTVRNTTDTKDLISDLTWKLKYGERWWLSGLNGAGKSTLSRHIISTVSTTTNPNCTSSSSSTSTRKDETPTSDDEPYFHVLLQSSDVSYISTDVHMSFAKSHQCGRDVINMLGLRCPSGVEIDSQGTVPSYETIKTIMKWLNLPKSLLMRPFNELSQGEQRMLLIAGALSYRPILLVLDEPLQGLDIANRHRVLGVVDRICSVTNISLIYVTHHYEDLIPALTHVLHLVNGKLTFKGTVETFDGHNTLWSNKLKPRPKDEQNTEELEERKIGGKKKRTKRVWY